METRAVFVFAVLIIKSVRTNGEEPSLQVDWANFLARADPMFHWNETSRVPPPSKWYESAFTGNGALGLMVRTTLNASTGLPDGLRIDLGRTDVYDDRVSPPGGGMDAGRANFACDRPRLPIGIFLVHFSGQNILSLDMRLKLFDAEVEGTVVTALGTCTFEMFSNARYDIADVSAIRFSCNASEHATLTWVPHAANSTWAKRCGANYKYNPPPVTTTNDGITTTNQVLHADIPSIITQNKTTSAARHCHFLSQSIFAVFSRHRSKHENTISSTQYLYPSIN